MKLVATKLEMETVGKMSKLVIDNVDAIASDLTVLDSRLLLGNANIDVVALDGTGSLGSSRSTAPATSSCSSRPWKPIHGVPSTPRRCAGCTPSPTSRWRGRRG